MSWLKPSKCTCTQKRTHAEIKSWIAWNMQGEKTKGAIMGALYHKLNVCSKCTAAYLVKEYK